MRFSSCLLLLILSGCSWFALTKSVRNQHDSIGYLNSVDYSSMLRKFQQWRDLKPTSATLRGMSRPRCGVADFLSLRINDHKWSRSSLIWSLRSYPRQIKKARALAIVREAFDVWLAHIPLQIKEACSTCSADILLSFKRYNHACHAGSFDGSGNTLGHAFFPEDGRIHFDADEPWTEKFDGSGINFYSVAVHEIGHALGIPHNNDRGSIMHRDYQLFRRGSMLPDYDRRSIQNLYGSSSGSGGGDANQTRCNSFPDQCCSKWGFPGTSEEYCGENCVAGPCWLRRNDDDNEPTCNCPSGHCCSKWGSCGTSEDYCGAHCVAGPCWSDNDDGQNKSIALNGDIAARRKSVAVQTV